MRQRIRSWDGQGFVEGRAPDPDLGRRFGRLQTGIDQGERYFHLGPAACGLTPAVRDSRGETVAGTLGIRSGRSR
jgi:hypothetical protein